MRKLMISTGAFALLASFGQAPAMAESLTLYCAADEAWCQLMAKDFEAETGITVDMTRKSSGEIYAQVKAEAENPKGDVWWAGTGDPHLQAAQEELTDPVRVAADGRAARLGDQAGRGRRPPHRRRLLGRARLRLQQGPARREQPARAEVLGRPDQARVQGPHPDRQPELLGHRLHHARDHRAADGRGEGLRVHEGAPREREPVHQVRLRPDQGRGPRRDHRRHRLPARRGGAGGGRLPDRAGRALRGHRLRDRLDVDHRGRPQRGGGEEVLRLGARRRRAVAGADGRTPSSSRRTRTPPSRRCAPDLSTIKLIDYDFAKYGSSEERKRLLSKWDDEVASLPQ